MFTKLGVIQGATKYNKDKTTQVKERGITLCNIYRSKLETIFI